MESVNPFTGKAATHYDEMTRDQVDSAIDSSHRAYRDWRRRAYAERAEPMRRAAVLLRERAGEYAKLMAVEMGKPVADGIAEARKCAAGCDFYAENAERFLAAQPVDLEDRKARVVFAPLGVVLAVMPWNFPFWQVIRFAAPALMAGNAAVLKHAGNVPGCALALECLFQDAGFPQHLFRTLLIGSAMVGEVIEHPHVRAVTLTGSAGAGRAVAAKAGQCLKKTVLELGGSDAYVVLADADIAFAAAQCARARLVNAGQSCIAAKRFIVIESVMAEFEKQLVMEMGKARMGDPQDENTTMGPLARHDLRDALHLQVRKTIDMGARCLIGGAIPADAGAFYPPTVLGGVRKGTPAHDEEMFGPVAAVIGARDENEAFHLANDSAFGLGGAVFTRDLVRGEAIARDEIEAGLVFVNAPVESNPKLPFGGIKESGYGRELSSFGIQEFVNIKTVVVAPHTAARSPVASLSE
ncbi:MAG TPA: NAD-dependent succinate-semialdehyde dehydrogenase [Rhizomicrobium sp.]|jgi:succinate-semialdehyde dehydrogenase/glutarate-semialdehyde dehydrogenase|nr:NAD-dependent succinate-semialdehyde dehydrogenase [Rhizomicrobium sp.]